MKPGYLKLCKLLAASDCRERDIVEFAQTLLQVGPRTFEEDVLAMKRLLVELQIATPYDSPSHSSSEPMSEIVDKIEQLLTRETRLPKLMAIELLSSELLQRYPNISIPPESRKGFRAWIHRLTNIVPEKELLHLATSIRNRYVHERQPDWRLK